MTTLSANRPGIRIPLVLTLLLLLSAFRHTDVEGYTDPSFVDYQFSTVVVRMPNAPLTFKKQVEERLAKKFRKMKINMLIHKDLFPPTRSWTEEQIQQVYAELNVDAGLIIMLGSTGGSITPAMVMYDATTINGSTYGNATVVSVFRDHADFEIALIDAESTQTVWKGRLGTRGSGMLFTGEKSTAKGLVKGLIKEWKSAGHLPK